MELGKTISNTKLITTNKHESVSEKVDTEYLSNKGKNDDYFQLRMNREWKNKVKLISEMNNVSLSKFIRESVDRNIQSLTR